MKRFLIVFALLNCVTAQVFADAPAGAVKIADCTAPASGPNPVETIQVYRTGNGISTATVSVQYQSGDNISSTVPVNNVEWADDQQQTLAIQFDKFIIVNIKNGNSDDSTIGVAFGQAARPMSCQAQF